MVSTIDRARIIADPNHPAISTSQFRVKNRAFTRAIPSHLTLNLVDRDRQPLMTTDLRRTVIVNQSLNSLIILNSLDTLRTLIALSTLIILPILSHRTDM